MENNNLHRRKSDEEILHIAKTIAQCEIALNHQVDKLFRMIGLTPEEVIKGVDEEVRDEQIT